MFYKAPNSWGFSYSRVDDYLKEAQIKNLAFSKAWLRLGHYQPSLFGKWRSQFRGGFFIAIDGDRNPEAELTATLRAFFAREDSAEFQCRYLARREWIKKNLAIHHEDLLSCPEQDEWRKKLDATGVSLIFASADASSSSSIYGHTFLKIISRNQTSSDRDLLNYGVNYAARATDKEGLVYAFKGLFGFYKGGFTMQPYHEKLREYVNLEGRDIWEYRLNLNQEQVDQMVNHLLEIKDAWSPYYFAWDNCSYQLLGLLEVAHPDIELVNNFNWVVIPIDTLKVISRTPGLVQEKKLRRSLKKDFTENYAQLNSRQRKVLQETIDKGNLPSVDSLSLNEQANVLDAATKYFTLKSYKDEKNFEEEKYKLLIARSRLGKVPQIISDQKQIPPDESHDSAGIYLGGGRVENLNFFSLKLRPAFHDIVSPDEALFEYSQNEVLSADLRYFSDQSRLDLHRFTLVNLLTSLPVNELEKPLSWKIEVYSEPKLSPHVQTGFGYSLDLPTVRQFKTRFIGLLSAQVSEMRKGIGPDLFLLHKYKDKYSIYFNYRGSWNNENYKSLWSAQLGLPLSRQWEFRLDYLNEQDSQEWQLRLLKQFIL